MDAKCIRIEFEYDDGTVYLATGDDAERINQAVDTACVMAAIHGVEYKGPQLQKVEKEKHDSQT